MKKLLSLTFVILSFLNGLAQSLTGPSSVASGTKIELTANGETTSSYIGFISLDPTKTATTVPNAAAVNFISTGLFQKYQNFDNILGLPTKIRVEVFNSHNVPVTVKFGFNVSLLNANGSPVNTVLYYTLVIQPQVAPTTYYNTVRYGNFTRNNCEAGYIPGPMVLYTVPAGKHSSTISQADADAKAQADINANGQAYANLNGTCIADIVKTPVSTGNIFNDDPQDIKWNPSFFSGNNVKIEVWGTPRFSTGIRLVLTLSASTANTGILAGALDDSVLPEQGIYFIRVTSIDTGTYYDSQSFNWWQD